MKFSSLVLLTFISLNIFAQKAAVQAERDKRIIAETKTTYIKTDTSLRALDNIKAPFSSIRVWDARLDTTMFCSVIYFNIFTGFSSEKVNFKGGAGKGISLVLNNYFKSNLDSSKGELICVIKKLAFNNRDSINDNMRRKITYALNCDIECFYKQDDKYYPATKLDTSFIEAVPPDNSAIYPFVTKLMTALSNKLSRINLEKVLRRNAYSKQVFEENYTSRFNMPILKNAIATKGVYRNISEFRNNKPSITNFTHSFENNNKIILLDERKEIISTLRLFGFSDGKDMWLLCGNKAFPLIRVNNSFELIVRFLTPSTPSYPANLLASVDLEDDAWSQKITWLFTRDSR